MKMVIKRLGLIVAMLLTILPVSAYDFEVDGIYYEVISLPDLTCKVVSGDKRYEGDIVIPDEISYNSRTLKVTEIGNSAFYNCESLTSIVIPDSVTEIEDYAFYYCHSLASFVIPDSMTKIGRCAFTYCNSLTSFVIPNSVTEIGESAFKNCKSLTSIVIPDSVTEIGYHAFENCKSLEEINLSNSLQTLECGTFEGCSSLKSLTIPGSVTKLVQYESGYEDYTFGGCDALKEIKFEYGSEEIAGYYFYYIDYNNMYTTTNITFSKDKENLLELEKVFIDRKLGNTLKLPYLKELTLGEHVEEVQINPSKSKELETITCYASVPPSCPNFTNSQYLNTVVKVPNESLEAYQNAEGWKNFWNIEGFSGIESVTSDKHLTEIGRYDLNGKTLTDNYEGIAIIRYSNGSTKKIVVRK